MIEHVTLAEDFIAKNGKADFGACRACLPHLATPADIAPMLRGAVAVRRDGGSSTA